MTEATLITFATSELGISLITSVVIGIGTILKIKIPTKKKTRLTKTVQLLANYLQKIDKVK